MSSNNWQQDLSWSKAAFLNLVWPELNNFLGGQMRVVEGSNEEMDRTLDRLAGIDVWHIQDGGQGISGIASRVQECIPPMKPYNTFTIRKSRITGTRTEYQKLTEAIKAGRLYPSLFVQAYISNKKSGDLLSFGIAPTKKIVDYIDSGKARINNTHNADFFIIPFNAVADFIYPKIEIKSKSNFERQSTIIKISQCHLNPGWNVDKLNRLFEKYNVWSSDDWDKLTDNQLKQMFAETKE